MASLATVSGAKSRALTHARKKALTEFVRDYLDGSLRDFGSFIFVCVPPPLTACWGLFFSRGVRAGCSIGLYGLLLTLCLLSITLARVATRDGDVARDVAGRWRGNESCSPLAAMRYSIFYVRCLMLIVGCSPFARGFVVYSCPYVSTMVYALAIPCPRSHLQLHLHLLILPAISLSSHL